MDQPHGRAEPQTQPQLSPEAQHLHYLTDELERDEKGKNDTKFQPEGWLCWKNSRAAAWHGFIRRVAAADPGKQEQPGCSTELFILPPKREAARSQEESRGLHSSADFP